MTVLKIKDSSRDQVLAVAEEFNGAFVFEGNYYFAPEHVQSQNLIVTDKLYNCPYKGIANWLDLKTANGKIIEKVAWVYPNPKIGYERIKDHIGFYKGKRMGTESELEL